MKFTLYLLKLILRVLFRVQVRGLEKLDFSKPLILMPNHISLLDAVFLALYLPSQVTFVANTGIAKRFSFIMKFRSHITIDPLNPYSIRKMVRVVKEGKPLVLFPEGRINTTSGSSLMKIYSGMGYLALKTSAQVYPVVIQGLERSRWSYLGEKNKTVWFPRVGIIIGTPFTIERNEQEMMRVQKKQATDKVYRVLQNAIFESRVKQDVNLYQEVLSAARDHGWKRVIAGDITSSVTYQKLLLGSTVLSLKLRDSVHAQTTVGVLLPSSIGHLVTLLGLCRLGVRPAILNFSQGTQTIQDCCATAEIRNVLTSRVFIEKGGLQEVVEGLLHMGIEMVYLEDLKSQITMRDKLIGLMTYKAVGKVNNKEVILFTSGSESKPKGVVLSHDQIYANVQQVLCSIDVTSKDKIFNALPMFHSFGLTAGTFLPILAGVPTYLYPSPLHYKAIPELCYEQNATILFGTSTFLAGYGRMAHPYDFYSLRYVFAGAEKLKEEVRQLWLEKFGVRIFEGYGATETSPILSLNTPLAIKRGTVGRLVPGIRAKLVPVEGIGQGGRLLVQGLNVMRGYLISGKGFVPADDWYDTGDVVSIDSEGYLQIQARMKRFAKVGGEMVSLQSVEDLASRAFGHPQVAAISVPDARKGERILLYTEQPQDQLESIRHLIREQGFSPLLCPYRIEAVEKIPLLGSGKTDYVTLQQWGNSRKEGISYEG
ncbi:AMP-binding protein [Ammoniphilus sp. CFH 90114]|uniref:AMP-binding protein n=1 Tax=Ammoniphilus sp. CFH 90114 TaxID=2493665 RepID=UPI0010100693|nr:AMP-binding protein [Ammoniphilus sp. CFH 90114]RXT03826.1 2-acyl-glycerophospho-ethanolamine acyltransferase [Ammoniphilus sp. CFH 90114]